MRRPFRPFRSRLIRLLASWLVASTLLGNGLAMAQQGISAQASKDCCADMPGHKAAADCGHGGKPCPLPTASCSDQCLARNQANLLMPPLVPALPGTHATTAALPLGPRIDHPTPEPGPGLRPPISV